VWSITGFAHSASAHQYDLGNPNTFSAMKHRMSCGLTGAKRGIHDSRR